MNATVIEAMSQFEPPRPICAQASGPDDTVRCRAGMPPHACGGSAVSMDTA
jgi:hypothetical protein